MTYRKLKDYICHYKGAEYVVFGDLMLRDCCYSWQDENGSVHEWAGCVTCGCDMDFLLDYYVVDISPKFTIEENLVITYLHVTLRKEEELS